MDWRPEEGCDIEGSEEFHSTFPGRQQELSEFAPIHHVTEQCTSTWLSAILAMMDARAHLPNRRSRFCRLKLSRCSGPSNCGHECEEEKSDIRKLGQSQIPLEFCLKSYNACLPLLLLSHLAPVKYKVDTGMIGLSLFDADAKYTFKCATSILKKQSSDTHLIRTTYTVSQKRHAIATRE